MTTEPAQLRKHKNGCLLKDPETGHLVKGGWSCGLLPDSYTVTFTGLSGLLSVLNGSWRVARSSASPFCCYVGGINVGIWKKIIWLYYPGRLGVPPDAFGWHRFTIWNDYWHVLILRCRVVDYYFVDYSHQVYKRGPAGGAGNAPRGNYEVQQSTLPSDYGNFTCVVTT